MTGIVIGLIVTALFAGFTSIGLRRNYREQYPATFGDWFWGVVTALVSLTVLSLIMGMKEITLGWAGLALAAVGVFPVLKVWAAPRKISMIGGVNPTFWLGVLLATLVATFLGGGIFLGFLMAAGLMGFGAYKQITTSAQQEQLVVDVAQPLAAVLGVTPERIWDSGPYVDPASGTIAVTRLATPTLNRLDRIPDLVTQIMPGYEVQQLDHSRIILGPVSVETIGARDLHARTEGLVSGESMDDGGQITGDIENWD